MPPTINTKQEILNQLHQNRNRLKALGLRRLGLFGSFVSEEKKEDWIPAYAGMTLEVNVF